MKDTVILTGIQNQFKARAQTFDVSARWVKDKFLLDVHRESAGVSKGDLILEVCCGTGVVGQQLSKSRAKVIGIDISLSMLGNAKKRLFSCINSQAERLPFKDNTFDVVICRQAFHFLDIKKVLGEMFRVVRSGTGRIVISQIVPFGKEDSDWLCQIHRKKQPLLKNFLTEQNLKESIERAGFQDLVSREYLIEEPISDWLVDTNFAPAEIKAIKEMFLNAPQDYKKLHNVRAIDNEVFDTMRWIVISAKCLTKMVYRVKLYM